MNHAKMVFQIINIIQLRCPIKQRLLQFLDIIDYFIDTAF